MWRPWTQTTKPIYFTHSGPRSATQPFKATDPTYGHVYHLGLPEDVMKMVNQEQSILWTAHPRTKSSETYPDDYEDKTCSSAIDSWEHRGNLFRLISPKSGYARSAASEPTTT